MVSMSKAGVGGISTSKGAGEIRTGEGGVKGLIKSHRATRTLRPSSASLGKSWKKGSISNHRGKRAAATIWNFWRGLYVSSESEKHPRSILTSPASTSSSMIRGGTTERLAWDTTVSSIGSDVAGGGRDCWRRSRRSRRVSGGASSK